MSFINNKNDFGVKKNVERGKSKKSNRSSLLSSVESVEQVRKSPNKFHSFHILKPSVLPFLVSCSLFLVCTSFVVWFNTGFYFPLLFGFFELGIAVYLWWWDISFESGEHTPEIGRGLKIGMGLFILSEVMFFFSFFWAFFHVSLVPGIELGGVWPPVGLEHLVINPWSVPLLNTFLLLASGVTVTCAHHSLLLYFSIENLLSIFSLNKLFKNFVVLEKFCSYKFRRKKRQGLSELETKENLIKSITLVKQKEYHNLYNYDSKVMFYSSCVNNEVEIQKKIEFYKRLESEDFFVLSKWVEKLFIIFGFKFHENFEDSCDFLLCGDRYRSATFNDPVLDNFYIYISSYGDIFDENFVKLYDAEYSVLANYTFFPPSFFDNDPGFDSGYYVFFTKSGSRRPYDENFKLLDVEYKTFDLGGQSTIFLLDSLLVLLMLLKRRAVIYYFLGVEFLVLTILLAFFFTLLQCFEYVELLICISDGVYGSTFFMMTGFHGIHVIIGSIFLTVCLFRIVSNHFYFKSSVGLECSIWYWHFVDVVWLFLFVVLYFWGNSLSDTSRFFGSSYFEKEISELLSNVKSKNNNSSISNVINAEFDSFFGGFYDSDFAFRFQCLFQDSATLVMEEIINLHHYIMIFLIFIFVFVIYIFSICFLRFDEQMNFKSIVKKYKLFVFKVEEAKGFVFIFINSIKKKFKFLNLSSFFSIFFVYLYITSTCFYIGGFFGLFIKIVLLLLFKLSLKIRKISIVIKEINMIIKEIYIKIKEICIKIKEIFASLMHYDFLFIAEKVLKEVYRGYLMLKNLVQSFRFLIKSGILYKYFLYSRFLINMRLQIKVRSLKLALSLKTKYEKLKSFFGF